MNHLNNIKRILTNKGIDYLHVETTFSGEAYAVYTRDNYSTEPLYFIEVHSHGSKSYEYDFLDSLNGDSVFYHLSNGIDQLSKVYYR